MFDYTNFFSTAHSGISGASFDIGTAFTALIGILIIVEGLKLLIEVKLGPNRRKSESQEYEAWKAHQEKMARWRATYDAEKSDHGPKAPRLPNRSNYL